MDPPGVTGIPPAARPAQSLPMIHRLWKI
jgi:hypothetical protein